MASLQKDVNWGPEAYGWIQIQLWQHAMCPMLGFPCDPSRTQIWGPMKPGGSKPKGRQQPIDLQSSHLSTKLAKSFLGPATEHS